MNVGRWDPERDGPLSERALQGKLEALGYRVQRWVYPPGTRFPEHTHDVDKIDAVVSGHFRVTLADGGAVLGPGECFGEIGYLSEHRRTASVVARGGASVLRINARALDRASASCRLQFQQVFIRTLIQRLVQTTQVLAETGRVLPC